MSTLVLVIIIVSNSKVNIKHATTDLLVDLVNNQEAHVDYYLNEKINFTKIVASTTLLAENLSKINELSTSSPNVVINDILKKSLSITEDFNNILVIDRNGKVVASAIDTELGQDYSKLNIFVEGKTAAGIFFIDKNKITTIYTSAPVYFNGQMVGMVVVELKNNGLEKIANVATEISSSTQIVMGVLGADGNPRYLIGRPNGSNFSFVTVDNKKLGIPLRTALSGGESVLPDSLDYRGVHVFSVSKYLDSKKIAIVAKVDLSEINSPVTNTSKAALITFLFAIFISGFVAWFLADDFSRPLVILSGYLKKIKENDFDFDVKISGDDEIGLLENAFSEMSVNLKKDQSEIENNTKNLEIIVKQKTNDLKEKIDSLNETRLAVLNVAQDAENEQTKASNLAKDLAKYKLAFESTSEQIVIANRDGIVLYCNPATEKLTGYSLEEAVGAKAGKLWGGMMDKEFYKKMWGIILFEKKVFIGELTNKRKNGEVYTAAVNISPVLDSAGEVEFFVAVERDVTIEREVDRMKTEFISVASHQLRTPLTAIKLFTEMLGEEEVGKLEPKQAEYVRDIHESTDRMVKLVNDLLNVARLESGRLKIEPKPLQIEKILADCISEFELVSKAKNSKITFEKPSVLLPLIQLDDTLIRQVFHNLVGNSLKYAKDGGVLVEVKLTTTELSPIAKALISKHVGSEIEPSVFITVSDNGIGIPEAVQKRIFEKFFRADNAVKSAAEGTGLGLYICKMVVDASKGHVWFESVVGKGTTFYITLPLKGMVARKGEKSLS